MKKRYEGYKMKDFKKLPNGIANMYNQVNQFMDKFNINDYYNIVKDPIIEDLHNFLAKINEIPTEEQTGEKGKKNMLWKMIPWFKRVMDYL